MITKILKTELEYEQACERIYNLIHSSENPIEPNSPEGEEIELLSLFIEKYEKEHYKIEAPDPIVAIQFRIEQMNLKQIDIAPLFGGETRISEVLNRKRPLSLKMIILINRYLGIPFESLLAGRTEVKLEPKKLKKLLKIPSINNFIQNDNNIAFV